MTQILSIYRFIHPILSLHHIFLCNDIIIYMVLVLFIIFGGNSIRIA
jgi:hypothetical protein